MSRAAQAAAFRLACSLPKRTHEWQPIRGQWGVKRSAEETAELTRQLREAEAAGATREQMKAAFSISQHTIEKLIGKVRK